MSAMTSGPVAATGFSGGVVRSLSSTKVLGFPRRRFFKLQRGQMLAAVEGNDGAGDRAVLDEIANGAAKVGEIGRALEGDGGDLPGKALLALVRAGQDGPGRDAVDANSRGQGERQRFGRR